MKHLSSRDNPFFKALKKLCQSGRERRKTGKLVLDGLHLVECYTQRLGAPEAVVVSEHGAAHPEIAAWLGQCAATTSITTLSDRLFDELATVDTPSGIMAVVAQPSCRHAINPQADTVLLDGVQDPGNLGSILRSAAAAGFVQILLAPDCAQAWSPKTLRAAMGAHFQLDLHEAVDLVSFLGDYRGEAMLTSLATEASLYSLDLAQSPVAWVFGSEGQGVRPEVLAVTPRHVRIPMPGATESLNVAAAAAVCLFETARQRQLGAST